MSPVERLRILLDLDIAAARRAVPCMPDGKPMTDDGLLAGMHKTRMHVTELPRPIRSASVQWLRERGYSDLRGGPLPAPGELPD